MKAVPEVSVVIPAYNAARYLERAVESVLAQTGPRYELIIVDNNSTDATASIAHNYQNRYAELITVLTEAKPGASAARNRGLAAARAPWIRFLDADDVLLPGNLRRQLTLVKPEIDWLIGTIRLRDVTGRERDASVASDPWRGLLTYTGLGHLDANLFRVATLRKLGGFNEDYPNCNDFELFFRLLKKGVAYSEDLVPGAKHIHHAGPRITNLNQGDMARRRLELTGRVIDYLKKEKPAYFRENQAMINTALLRVIRKQATVDLVTATANFKRLFPEGYQRSDFEAGQLPGFVRVYPVLGFRIVEGGRRLMVNLVPEKIRSWLKG